MILIIDLCWKDHSLSRTEFVDPVANIVKSSEENFEIVHHLAVGQSILKNYKGVILCGTALKDNGFRSNDRLKKIIRDTDIPVLGVCAGMQVIALAYDARLTSSLEIGMNEIKITENDRVLGEEKTIQAYKLHGMRMVANENFIVLAESDKGPEAVRHVTKPVWGALFHPEVRNEGVVRNFISFCRR